ncbi:MAG TPA: TlpA disulfide reductase family protein [Dissulfurispiraceae bacterium]
MFVLAGPNNNRVSLGDYKGKVVMLEFFATWCPPCQMAAPDVESVYEKYKDRGFVVLAVSIDEGSDRAAAVGSFVKDLHLTYPVLLDDGKTSGQYGVSSIPTSYIIDRQGKLRNKHVGLLPDYAATLSKEIEALL